MADRAATLSCRQWFSAPTLIAVLATVGFVSPASSQGPGVPTRAVPPPRIPPQSTAPTGSEDGPLTQAGAVANGPLSAGDPRRITIAIDPKTPLKDLLPAAPKNASRKPALLGDDLSQAPEAALREPVSPKLALEKAAEEIARQVAHVNHVNKQKPDHFMRLLLDERADLRGLPFMMGDDCRTQGERRQQFTVSARLLRDPATFLAQTDQKVRKGEQRRRQLAEEVEELADDEYDGAWAELRLGFDRADKELSAETARTHAPPARVAATMQIFAPTHAKMKAGLVKYLAGVPHVDASRALAKLAIFSPDEEVRRAAVTALQVRRERDYSDVLMEGFRYPWPPVARRAADAIIQLERKDLAVRLLDVLDEPDPRAPVTKKVKEKSVPVVRELVRINHHRNCLLCHAPGSPEQVTPETMVAAIPIPGQPLPTNGEGYGSNAPDAAVRIDVTYLRQDFSLMQPVANAQPWPEMQRFDFLVRSRELTDEEAAEYQKLLKRDAGVLPPNHRAALLALRELTGKDAAPTSAAWRELLALKTTDGR